jgi:hypothetical protein
MHAGNQGRGEPTLGADGARMSPLPTQMHLQGASTGSPVTAQLWTHADVKLACPATPAGTGHGAASLPVSALTVRGVQSRCHWHAARGRPGGGQLEQGRCRGHGLARSVDQRRCRLWMVPLRLVSRQRRGRS